MTFRGDEGDVVTGGSDAVYALVSAVCLIAAACALGQIFGQLMINKTMPPLTPVYVVGFVGCGALSGWGWGRTSWSRRFSQNR